MASESTVEKVFAMVFFKAPGRKPKDLKEFNVILEIWKALYKDLTDHELMTALGRWTKETKTVFPNDDPFAKILDMASPRLVETQGDVIELAQEAVSRFGYVRENDAMAWMESKSPLCAAAMRRIGFREYCLSENPDVVRGQLRNVFETEKRRAQDLGGIVHSAQDLQNGKAILPGSKDLNVLIAEMADRKQLPGRKSL